MKDATFDALFALLEGTVFLVFISTVYLALTSQNIKRLLLSGCWIYCFFFSKIGEILIEDEFFSYLRENYASFFKC